MKILSYTLFTRNIQATRDFYEGILGFTVKDASTRSITFQVGHSNLVFENTDKEIIPTHYAFNLQGGMAPACLNFYSEKLDLLKNPDVPNETDLFDFVNWDAEAIYFYDDNGNIGEFIARKGLGQGNTSSFSPLDVLSVGEVGVVVDAPLKTAEYLKKKYGITDFDKSPGKESFKPIGNDEGLFILAKKERNWYPTDFAAKSNPFKVTFETGKGVFDWEV